MLNNLLPAAAIQQALKRTNRQHGRPKITFFLLSVLVAIYVQTQDTDKTPTRNIWINWNGRIILGNYDQLRMKLEKLHTKGFVNKIESTYRNRKTTHWSLSITGQNFLHDLNKYMTAGKKPRK